MENKSPLVSIIMPVYNGEKTIKYSVASLLRQTYTNWICIIVDDGSTDATAKILDTLHDSRFHVIRLKENRGRGYARDIALKHVQGKYLAYLDADDMIHHDKLKSQVDFLESNSDIQMVGCGCIIYDEKNIARRACKGNSFVSSECMQYGQPLPLLLATTMVRVDHAKQFNYNRSLDVGEDYDYFARYCTGYRYANIGELYYYYFMGNVTKKKILYYQIKDMKSIVVLWKMNIKILALKKMLLRMIKLLIYSLLLLFVDATKLSMSHRGINPEKQQIKEFNKEIAGIFNRGNVI